MRAFNRDKSHRVTEVIKVLFGNGRLRVDLNFVAEAALM